MYQVADFNKALPTSLRSFDGIEFELVGYELRPIGSKFDHPAIRIYFRLPSAGQLYVSETRDKPVIRDQLRTAMETGANIVFRTGEYKGEYGGLRGIVLVPNGGK